MNQFVELLLENVQIELGVTVLVLIPVAWWFAMM